MNTQSSNNKFIITHVNANGKQESFELKYSFPEIYVTKGQLQASIDTCDELMLAIDKFVSTKLSLDLSEFKLQGNQVAANEPVILKKKKK